MRAPRVWTRVALATAILLQPMVTPTAEADPIFGRLTRMVKEAHYHGEEPETCEVTAIEDLAKNIDWLEHHVDRYGSIVAKQPDIWGEARLTKHRDEYERLLFQELGGFETRINAAIVQTDTAFFAQALALSAAVAGEQASLPSRPGLVSAPATTAASTGAIVGASTIQLEPVIELDQLSRYAQHLHELRRVNEGDDIADSPGYSLNLVRVPVSILPGKLTRRGFGAEVTVTATPVMSDDLMPTTFRNLVINDLVDQMGLPLVRSVEMPDDEVAATSAALADIDLIEELFNAIIAACECDGIEKSCESIMRRVLTTKHGPGIVSDVLQGALNEAGQECTEVAPNGRPQTDDVPATRGGGAGAPGGAAPLYFLPGKMRENFKQGIDNYRMRTAAAGGDGATQQAGEPRSRVVPASLPKPQEPVLVDGSAKLSREKRAKLICELKAAIEARDTERSCKAMYEIEKDPFLVEDLFRKTAAGIAVARNSADAGVIPTGRARRAIYPVAPSQVGIVGLQNFQLLVRAFSNPYNGRYIRWNGGTECGTKKKPKECRVGLLDAQRFLQAEVSAAHSLLARPESIGVLHALARPGSGLAAAVRANHLNLTDTRGVEGATSLVGFRKAFFHLLHHPEEQGADPRALAQLYDAGQRLDSPLAHARNSIETLAWAYVVEAALLNQQLNDDIRKLARAKHRMDLDTGRDYAFFLPDSVTRPDMPYENLRDEFQQATELFQRYVEVRWPIYVFALDPREQDQNVADASARRREMQFAMSLAFVNGKIGANSLTQFARAQEKQIQTVGLNRTAAGFAHGANTFGWRFAPRVQGLEAPGTLGALKQTVCGIHPDADIRNRQIEPGMREAIAIVVMPSFVPYVDFDVHTNWFKLSNPKNAALTMRDTMRLSRAVAAMKNSRARCAGCQHLYREGELVRLFRRIDQLDAELPLQSMRVQAPYENTLGGFEMFNTGVTDLAPELVGWYGAPGIVIDDEGTNKFACGCSTSCENGGRAVLTTTNGDTTPLPICEGEGTTVFLVGDNFSVHDTKVIAGGVCIPHVQLVSREIMRVTIPSCVNTVKLSERIEGGRENEYVSVYAATPYGVTNHLHIPVQKRAVSDTTKTAIAAAVGSAVKSQIAALRLAPRDVGVKPVDDSQEKVEVEAFCVKENPADLKLHVRKTPSLLYCRRKSAGPEARRRSSRGARRAAGTRPSTIRAPTGSRARLVGTLRLSPRPARSAPPSGRPRRRAGEDCAARRETPASGGE